jgi:hypothetical protein
MKEVLMSDTLVSIERLEALAAWHRINAEHAGSDWIWEARLRTAEELERRAAALRIRQMRDTSRRSIRQAA